MKSWCIFCKTGSEKKVAQSISAWDENFKVIAPVRILQEKRKGRWLQKEQILFPGYVFLYSEEDLDIEFLKKVPGFYKVLGSDATLKELRNSDYEYSMWIYRHQGYLETSKVLTIGRTVKVIEGPLADGLGTIVKLDKHKRRVWVEFEFDNKLRLVSLSAECVEEQ